LLEKNGFKIIKQKGSILFYGKEGWNKLIRVDYHGSKEMPSGTCHSIEDCLYKAKWGMKEHIELLKQQDLPIPKRSIDPKIIIQNEHKRDVA